METQQKLKNKEMKLPILPKNIRRIADDEKFAFACHTGVDCFTHCCRQLELSLTPYDMLRLKNALGLDSSEFLEKYVITEQDDTDIFPRFYLTMVDDGNASCVFVTPKGCTVYTDRPGACRAYPLGRAAMRKADNSIESFFVLLNEEHCNGFGESCRQTARRYSEEQGLDTYNRMNDLLGTLLQHERIRGGMRLSDEQVTLFTHALYDLDTFRKRLFSGQAGTDVPPPHIQEELADDEKLLLYAIEWLKERFFAEEDRV